MRFLNRAETDPPPIRLRRQRRLRRRVIYAGMTLSVLGAAAVGAWYLQRNSMAAAALARAEIALAHNGAALDLTVQSVEVEGRDRADRQAILDALAVRRGTPILDVDLEAARTRLEAIPWVRSAAVERLLPDTIYVRLVEHQPIALWQHHGKFDLIDEDGAVIPGARVADFPGLLQVVGDGAPEAAADLLDLLSSEPDLARHVNAAVRLGARRWNLALDNGIEIDLPEDAAAAAWHRVAALDRSDRLLERDIKAVDLRLPDRLVLRLSPETAKSLTKKIRPAGPNT